MDDKGISQPKLAKVLELKQWFKIQELFADVIGVSIYTVDPYGELLVKPSKTTRLCSELRASSLFCLKNCVACIKKNIDDYFQIQKVEVPCHCGFFNFVIPIIAKDNELLGFIIAGPVLLGMRKNNAEYLNVCDSLGIDAELYIDAISEMKILSSSRVESIVALLKDAITYMVKIGYEKNNLEDLLPGLIIPSNGKEYRNSNFYVEKVLGSLLNIAIELTNADTGSVLLRDKNTNTLNLLCSKGLKFYGKALNSKNKIAKIVATKKKGYLINSKHIHHEFKDVLLRAEISASFVVPVFFKDDFFGVLSLNSYESSNNFNKNNLKLLEQLTSLAGVSLSSI